jgi:hypothetical protein
VVDLVDETGQKLLAIGRVLFDEHDYFAAKAVGIVGEMTQVVLTIRRPGYRTPSMLHSGSSCKLGQ